MTGDQWFALLKLLIFLGFAAFVLYGVYRIMIRDDSKPNGDG